MEVASKGSWSAWRKQVLSDAEFQRIVSKLDMGPQDTTLPTKHCAHCWGQRIIIVGREKTICKRCQGTGFEPQ